jgi:hypothetical protein
MPGIADTALSVIMVIAPTFGYFDQVKYKTQMMNRFRD